MMRRARKRLRIVSAIVLVPIIICMVLMGLRHRGNLFRLETLAYDSMISTQAGADPDASPVAIIGISEEDIRAWQQYPISDRVMHSVLRRLLAGRPRVIGIDIYRDFPVADRNDPTKLVHDHNALVDTIIAHPNVLVIERLLASDDDNEYVLPPARLNENDANQQVAATAIATDGPGGSVRRVEPFFENLRTGKNAVSLGVLAALKHLADDNIDLVPEEENDAWTPLRLGKARITRPQFPAGFYQGPSILPSWRRGEVLQYMVDFRAPRQLKTYSVSEVMDESFDLNQLQGKLLIVGVTAKSVKDYVSTPHGSDTFGFVMHGYIADQLIRWAKGGAVPPAPTSNGTAVLWVLGWCVLGSMTGALGKLRSMTRMVLFVLIEIGLLILLSYLLLQYSTIVPFVPALAGMVASVGVSLAYISAVDRKEQRMVQQLMDMHISRPIAERLMENGETFFQHGKLLPQRTVATVLFSDLMDFTPIAERLDSTALMNWLNEFFNEMTAAVEACGGVVNKFNGDMVMALFGPPRLRETPDEIANDARDAVRCAVLMRRALAKMNRRWQEEGMPTPRMRIGISTGPLVAGSLGGKNRLEYTVIGDTVNTASRLESSNKECMEDAIDGTRIIIGDATRAALGQAFHTRPVGLWDVKGKTDALQVHAVIDYRETT